ncbi:hypothetical protein COMA2_240052 [Candidatus Nitrospira nitrificans]|uniref:Uncharacterized protein n=1 Tax=Candidatus Nitrospira nitrificans TaxID=1742973 RepID=A0A0S4LIR3_9BACT|nr:hypothetical protein COMA2_240052 [Candidatus Nitrospira nitrificans]
MELSEWTTEWQLDWVSSLLGLLDLVLLILIAGSDDARSQAR